MSLRNIVRGIVVSGIGEAGFYVKLYSDFFKGILGGEPYPGTLNILVESCGVLREIFSENHLIHPLKPGLAPAYVRRGVLRGISVLVVKPLITRHECRILELVSTVNLRSMLRLKNGDLVEVELF
ncbi:MAG: CTP-dependent riboflavin kinase [Desulfurococcaceae archaeon]|nr:CTP-dependent riboflavin kinase [Desulfurococcaceae archaeon]